MSLYNLRVVGGQMHRHISIGLFLSLLVFLMSACSADTHSVQKSLDGSSENDVHEQSSDGSSHEFQQNDATASSNEQETSIDEPVWINGHHLLNYDSARNRCNFVEAEKNIFKLSCFVVAKTDSGQEVRTDMISDDVSFRWNEPTVEKGEVADLSCQDQGELSLSYVCQFKITSKTTRLKVALSVMQPSTQNTRVEEQTATIPIGIYAKGYTPFLSQLFQEDGVTAESKVLNSETLTAISKDGMQLTEDGAVGVKVDLETLSQKVPQIGFTARKVKQGSLFFMKEDFGCVAKNGDYYFFSSGASSFQLGRPYFESGFLYRIDAKTNQIYLEAGSHRKIEEERFKDPFKVNLNNVIAMTCAEEGIYFLQFKQGSTVRSISIDRLLLFDRLKGIKLVWKASGSLSEMEIFDGQAESAHRSSYRQRLTFNKQTSIDPSGRVYFIGGQRKTEDHIFHVIEKDGRLSFSEKLNREDLPMKPLSLSISDGEEIDQEKPVYEPFIQVASNSKTAFIQLKYEESLLKPDDFNDRYEVVDTSIKCQNAFYDANLKKLSKKDAPSACKFGDNTDVYGMDESGNRYFNNLITGDFIKVSSDDVVSTKNFSEVLKQNQISNDLRGL